MNRYRLEWFAFLLIWIAGIIVCAYSVGYILNSAIQGMKGVTIG